MYGSYNDTNTTTYIPVPGLRHVAAYVVFTTDASSLLSDEYTSVDTAGVYTGVDLLERGKVTVVAVFSPAAEVGNVTLLGAFSGPVAVGVAAIDLAGHVSVTIGGVVVPYSSPPALIPGVSVDDGDVVGGLEPLVATWPPTLCVCYGPCSYDVRVALVSFSANPTDARARNESNAIVYGSLNACVAYLGLHVGGSTAQRPWIFVVNVWTLPPSLLWC